MEVKNCKDCGRLFNYVSGPRLCPACAKKLEDKFQQVKEYIRKSDFSSIAQVAEDNEVSVNQIKQWVREERLSFDAKSGIGLECESCGALISTGRFCNKCKSKVQSELEGALPKVIKAVPKKMIHEKGRMRFLDK